MSRKVTTVLLVVGCLGVGSTIAWSNIATSVGTQVELAKVDLDQPSTDAIAIPRRDIMPASLTKADFDQAFADATAIPRRDNTPANREKLREAGWKRIIGSR